MSLGVLVQVDLARASGGGDDPATIDYTPYWAHLDHLGTPIKLTNESGAVVWHTWHEPFGATVALNEDPDGDGNSVVLNLRFSRQYYDAETGLHYNWHRYYDPVAGRYLAPDFLQIVDGNIAEIDVARLVKDYGYSHNSPLRMVDTLGLGYIDLNYTLGFCSIGVMINDDGFYFYGTVQMTFGIGVPFAVPSITIAPEPTDNPTPGWNPFWVSVSIPTNELLGPGYPNFMYQHGFGADGLNTAWDEIGLTLPGYPNISVGTQYVASPL